MTEQKSNGRKAGLLSRRQLLTQVSAGVLGATLAASTSPARARPFKGMQAAAATSGLKKGLNILYIFTDQERYFSDWPSGLDLPGHERLQEDGTTFTNHYIGAVMCTSSRAIMMTGLTTPDNLMYENLDMPWVADLNPKIPTIGHMLRKAGYYTAYKGKWHLSRAFDQHEPTRLFTPEMDAYGFSDYASPGDVVGHTLGGYQFDHLIGGSVLTWLRRHGRDLNDEGKPWALTVSLVNPHDVMYFNTDAPGENVQDNGRLLNHAARAPDTDAYKATWDFPLSPTRQEDLTAAGRPGAHKEYQDAWDVLLGHVPNEDERWNRLGNFYLNSIKSVDSQLAAIFNELDQLGLADRTIVVFSADHGEMAGAHGGLRGKGPFAYEECIHVPMHIMHPDVRGGRSSDALTAHIDFAPSFLALAGADSGQAAEFAGRTLPGKDFSSALSSPRTGNPNAIRESVLFTYSGLATVDSNVIKAIAAAAAAGKNPKEMAKSGEIKPDLGKRGTMRTAFDGRYKFSRYFSPMERHSPKTIEEIYAHNDVELFDLSEDPQETNNLATMQGQNTELVTAMSEKLERVISAEIGTDDGREMPEKQGKKIVWTLEKNMID